MVAGRTRFPKCQQRLHSGVGGRARRARYPAKRPGVAISGTQPRAELEFAHKSVPEVRVAGTRSSRKAKERGGGQISKHAAGNLFTTKLTTLRSQTWITLHKSGGHCIAYQGPSGRSKSCLPPNTAARNENTAHGIPLSQKSRRKPGHKIPGDHAGTCAVEGQKAASHDSFQQARSSARQRR